MTVQSPLLRMEFLALVSPLFGLVWFWRTKHTDFGSGCTRSSPCVPIPLPHALTSTFCHLFSFSFFVYIYFWIVVLFMIYILVWRRNFNTVLISISMKSKVVEHPCKYLIANWIYFSRSVYSVHGLHFLIDIFVAVCIIFIILYILDINPLSEV